MLAVRAASSMQAGMQADGPRYLQTEATAESQVEHKQLLHLSTYVTVLAYCPSSSFAFCLGCTCLSLCRFCPFARHACSCLRSELHLPVQAMDASTSPSRWSRFALEHRSSRLLPDGPPPAGWVLFGCSWLCLPLCPPGTDTAARTFSPGRLKTVR